jgi:CRP-like cAMP-binding protein
LASIEQSILSQSSRSEHWKEHSASYERVADLLRAMGHEEEAQLAGTRLLKARERAEKIKFGASHRPVQATRTDERSRDFDNRLVAFLRRHPFFSDLDPRSLDQLSRYAKHLDLKRGTRIFSKGDPGTSLFAVISGTVRISASYPDGRSAILNLVGPGELFGEIAVLDGQARSADAIASTNCELSAFDRRDFLPFVRTQPTLVMRLIELLCARLRSTSGQVEQIMLLDLPGRLAGALLNLAHGHRGVSNRTITITHQEIGEMIGTSRESVNKQLRAWAARQWVQLEHGRIVILEAEPLRALLEAKVGRT